MFQRQRHDLGKNALRRIGQQAAVLIAVMSCRRGKAVARRLAACRGDCCPLALPRLLVVPLIAVGTCRTDREGRRGALVYRDVMRLCRNHQLLVNMKRDGIRIRAADVVRHLAAILITVMAKRCRQAVFSRLAGFSRNRFPFAA